MSSSRLIERGDTILDFRGKSFVFEMITRNPGGPSEGKIAVHPTDEDVQLEFYPSVFDCFIRDRKLYAKTGEYTVTLTRDEMRAIGAAFLNSESITANIELITKLASTPETEI